MSIDDVNKGMRRLLAADTETSRALAIGELLERLLAAGGLRQDKIGSIATALLVLWRVDCGADDVEQAWERARAQAREALEVGGLDVDLLTKLGVTARQLGRVAVALQGEKLLAEVKPPQEYVPEEGDLVIWLGKHVAKVIEVDTADVIETSSRKTVMRSITQVTILTAGGQRIPISPRELTLYHRDDGVSSGNEN
jgi:hypothetical protein